LLVLRLGIGPAGLARVGEEWRRDDATYVYVTVSTAIVFACFGTVLGLSADRLARLGTSDGLTGLLNRAGMKERIAAEMRRLQRYPAPLSLLLLDVDRMKDINDRHGHRAGDDALRRVARAIATAMRATDSGSRWGGDEFLVLAPSTSLSDAIVLGSRIRAAAGAAADGHPLLSVSIGIATVPPVAPGPPVDELLQAADDALYQAKRAGGDQVATAQKGG
jgi:diguanylate cyclase (GGDEF)-like protein